MADRDIFCKIVSKEIPADIVYEDDDLIAFNDIAPKAKIHVVLIPKKHIGPHTTITENEAPIMGKMMVVANKIAAQVGVDKSGYRLVMNSGEDAGMGVDHIHLHILGGNKLGPIA
jgi:histidine triad (HIT) family protein